MTDHIQPEPARQGPHGPTELPEAADARLDTLLRRLAALEQEKQRWKRIGIGALVSLFLLLLGGGVGLVGTAGFYSYRLQAAQRAALEAELQAREQAEQARMEAEMRRHQAEAAMEQARRAAERKAEKEAK